MLKTYITTVPLQGKLDPMLYQRERAGAPTATCFPIVQVMRDTLEPGDTVQLLAIRQENADTARNYQRLLEELLPVIDNFEMGMAAASADASSMIYIGMSMVKKQLDEFLAGNGVSAVEPVVGSMFDHATEEALQRDPSDQPEGTVLRVIRKGYMLKDRLLRPANVVVAHTPDPEPQV